jgi:hypothetical protein
MRATSPMLWQPLSCISFSSLLNTRVKTNAVHVSLNFDPQDKPCREQLQQIAIAYMERIGFGDQPYLVYQHMDAAHMHVHIATVNIRMDGSRIDTHGIGWRLSEPARLAIEKEFGLVEASGKNLSNQLVIKPAAIDKAVYGKTLTKRAITTIVNAVIRDYRFTSLAEFNAVLRQFNVAADRGGEHTAMREKGGLLYSLLDGTGTALGVPVKASAIYKQPTLKNLQREFERNEQRREPYRVPLKHAIEDVFKAFDSLTKNTFIAELQKQHIQALFRTNEQGYTYGVTFIDNRNKTVFNGSDLGKGYGAKALIERFGTMDKPLVRRQQTEHSNSGSGPDKFVQLHLSLGKYQPQVAPSVGRKKKKRKGQDQELSI